MSLHMAEDYAVLQTDRIDCYYGYEVTDDEGSWCFEAKVTEGQRRIVFTQDDLQMPDQWDVLQGLLKGIELLINRGLMVLSPQCSAEFALDVEDNEAAASAGDPIR